MTNLMQDLYGRLEAAGLDRQWVKRAALPNWWEDRLAQNPAGYAEALSLLADHLSLNLRDLQDPSRPLQCEPFLAMRNKTRQGVCDEDLKWARCVCARAAQMACAAAVTPILPVPATAAEMRPVIGKDAHHVHLEALLDYCWSLGIPVLHVAQLPGRGSKSGGKKPDGMAARVGDRYAIVLSKNSRYSAWLLFILAHELGHIACGHLGENGLYVDGDDWAPNRETEEKEANDFAVELLTGAAETLYESNVALTTSQLAGAARYTSVTRRVDPGVVVLNYGRHTGHWGAAVGALKALEPNANAIATVQNRMSANLQMARLSDENRDFLLRVTGVEIEP